MKFNQNGIICEPFMMLLDEIINNFIYLFNGYISYSFKNYKL